MVILGFIGMAFFGTLAIVGTVIFANIGVFVPKDKR